MTTTASRVREALKEGRITREQLIAAAEESTFGMGNPGFCVACGHEQEGCEPDARNYTCDACDEMAVFGAMELLLYL